MCGIVGTAGNLLALDEKIFTELLFADVVRGKHATGVATVKGQCRSVEVHKRAMPSPLYLELGSTTQHLSGFIHNTAVIGHNRHATKGNSSDPEGAHPFKHDHITLVHNGSLTTHYNLTDDNFTVDSEAICKAIAIDGIEVVGPKLRGAFALVWIDAIENTLNFLRNKERPLAIAWNENLNRMWWASEKAMLEWSLNRDTYSRSPAPYTTLFELPVGKLISIPILATSINISDRVETEIDVSKSVDVYQSPVPYRPKHQATVTKTSLEAQAIAGPLVNEVVTEYKFGASRENALKKITAGLVAAKGRENFMARTFVSSLDMNGDAAILDERIGLFLTGWVGYTETLSGLGVGSGQMMEFPYTDVLIHGISEAEYDATYAKTSGMISAYFTGFKLPMNSTLTVKNGSLLAHEDLLKFTLLLRKDTIRKANLNDFCFDINEMPAEDTEVLKKATAIVEAFDKPTLVVDNPGPEEDTRIFALADGTQVSPGGTAVFKGASPILTANLRYKVVAIKYSAGTTFLTVSVGTETFVYSSDKWSEGTLSKEAYKLEEPKILGPDGEFITVGKWQVAVSKGCCHCNEIPSDPKVAEELEWEGSRFTCEGCSFRLQRIGYTS